MIVFCADKVLYSGITHLSFCVIEALYSLYSPTELIRELAVNHWWFTVVSFISDLRRSNNTAYIINTLKGSRQTFSISIFPLGCNKVPKFSIHIGIFSASGNSSRLLIFSGLVIQGIPSIATHVCKFTFVTKYIFICRKQQRVLFR